jgi:hypothetical membrane protein
VLLACGVASSLLYTFAADVIAATIYEGYSRTSQAVSELFAFNAPSRPVFLALGVIYSVLMIAFVGGVLAALQGPNLAAGQPTPWLGVTERINIGVFLLWVVVLAVTLWPKRTGAQTLLGTDGSA